MSYVGTKTLKEIVDLKHGVSTDQTRPALTYIMLRVLEDGETVEAVACDGHILVKKVIKSLELVESLGCKLVYWSPSHVAQVELAIKLVGKADMVLMPALTLEDPAQIRYPNIAQLIPAAGKGKALEQVCFSSELVSRISKCFGLKKGHGLRYEFGCDAVAPILVKPCNIVGENIVERLAVLMPMRG